MKWPDAIVRVPRRRSGGGLGVPAEVDDAYAFRSRRSSEGKRIVEGFKMLLDMENFQ